MTGVDVRGPDGGEGPSGPASAAAFVRLSLIFYAGLALAAVAWCEWARGRSALFADGGASLPLPVAVGIGLLAGGGLVLASRSWTERSERGRRLTLALADRLPPLTLPQCLVIAAVSGWGEELFFRAALQPELGWGIASLLFGAAHFVPKRDLWVWSLFSFGAGLIFAGLYGLTGGVVAPAIAHMVVNGLNLPQLVAKRTALATELETPVFRQ